MTIAGERVSPSVCDTQTFKCLDTASRTVVREDI